MQIMPGTADHLGLPRASIYDPEKNIAAAVKYLGELERNFSDIRERSERTKFVLAAYNGGHFHIRDAMALARKNGKNPQRWGGRTLCARTQPVAILQRPCCAARIYARLGDR